MKSHMQNEQTLSAQKPASRYCCHRRQKSMRLLLRGRIIVAATAPAVETPRLRLRLRDCGYQWDHFHADQFQEEEIPTAPPPHPFPDCSAFHPLRHCHASLSLGSATAVSPPPRHLLSAAWPSPCFCLLSGGRACSSPCRVIDTRKSLRRHGRGS